MMDTFKVRKSEVKDTNAVRVAELNTEIVGTPSERFTGFPFKKAPRPIRFLKFFLGVGMWNKTPK